MKYFAYGSNMSVIRLSTRIHVAKVLGVYQLPCHRLCFHKIGRDGSGKCNAYFTGDTRDNLPGVAYEIDKDDKIILDRIEGLGIGYREQTVKICDPHGNWLTAFTYTALKTDPLLLPYHWYKKHVLIGAREAGLPADHLSFIDAVPTLNDPDHLRQQRETAIYLGTTDSH